MMNAKHIWLVFLLTFALVHGFQRVQAESVDAYDTDPDEPLTITFETIDVSSTDYHLSTDATLAWEADPGSWELTIYYNGFSDQVQVTSGINTGALLSVAIGFDLDAAAAALDPPTDSNFNDDSNATYRIIRLGSVLKQVLADGMSVEDIGSRPFVLAASTKGGALNGAYAGTLTFDLDNGL